MSSTLPLNNSIPATNKASVFGTPLTVVFTGVSLLLLAGIGQLSHTTLLIPPLAATASYIFGMPGIPGTQPRSVVLGHLIAGIIGFITLGLLGGDMWVAALAAALAMLAMNTVKLFHIPAVATAALVVLVRPTHAVEFIGILVAASVFLSLMGVVFSKLTGKVQYPLYW
jgi:CBS-domain-containing membrane protein